MPEPGTGRVSGHLSPNWAALEQHEAPAWFNDAKLGIFIHGGSVRLPADLPEAPAHSLKIAQAPAES